MLGQKMLQNSHGIICLNLWNLCLHVYSHNPHVNNNHNLFTTSTHRGHSAQNEEPEQFAKLTTLNAAIS